MAISINSDTPIPIDKSFKVSAGPGAGKTHWLALHIKHVLKDSRRLGVSRKVACISYTNVGAETIRDRLPLATSAVEVSTIHSFLYTHVVKPFIHLEAENLGINYNKLQVVATESFVSSGFAYIIQQRNDCTWFDKQYFVKGLQKSYWHYDKGAYTYFGPDHAIKIDNKYCVPKRLYKDYVSARWSGGYLSYDDVLYLSKELLRLHPEIFNSLVAKFPYFFIDEFQDSIPPIVDFVKDLGTRGVVIGVVGDKAQTIYDFIGASVEQFNSFSTDGMEEYEIHGNRRSSQKIIDILNIIRPDFLQTPIDTEVGFKPVILIGDKLVAYQKASEMSDNNDVHSLAYQNIVSNSLRYKSDDGKQVEKWIDSDFDTNFARSMFVRNLLKATEYAYNNDLLETWHQLDVLNSDRGETITWLRSLLISRNELLDKSLLDFCAFLRNSIYSKLPKLQKGSDNYNFYATHTYLDMALSMKVSDRHTIHKTIHKAKGEEYENVMVVLNDENDLTILTSPDLNNNVAHRVYYVAMSRAEKRLFINVKEVSQAYLDEIRKLPVDIVWC